MALNYELVERDFPPHDWCFSFVGEWLEGVVSKATASVLDLPTNQRYHCRPPMFSTFYWAVAVVRVATHSFARQELWLAKLFHQNHRYQKKPFLPRCDMNTFVVHVIVELVVVVVVVDEDFVDVVPSC